MKHLRLWSILVVSAMLAGMMFYASCAHDEPEVIIRSEVVDEGIDTQVTTKPLPGSGGTESAGTQLSYNSMIKVKAETASGRHSAPSRAPARASSDDDLTTITVMLHAVFHNLDTTIVVNSFDIGEPTFAFTYGTNGRRTEGYVTVTDSVTYYNVNFDGFGFRYMLENEVAVYNDGYTNVIMPYHKIKNYRDNGFSVEDLSFVLEPNSSGGKDVYLRKKIKHSITVEYNGADYTLHGNVILKKRVGTHPCIVSSELIDKGISDIENESHYTYYTSWTKVKHQYSDNHTEDKTYSRRMVGKLEYNSEAAGASLTTTDIDFVSAIVANTGDSRVVSRVVSDNVTILTVEETKRLDVTYSQFSFSCPLYVQHASYNDGILVFDFPDLMYNETQEEHNIQYSSSDANMDYYWFNFRVSARFGDSWHTFNESLYVTVKK